MCRLQTGANLMRSSRVTFARTEQEVFRLIANFDVIFCVLFQNVATHTRNQKCVKHGPAKDNAPRIQPS